MAKVALVIGAAFFASACGSGFVHDEVLDVPYHLVAVDEMQQMSLCRALAGGDCAGDGLLGETIFAAGADSQFIVLGRHPREWPNPSDRTKTEYYYLIRTPTEAERGLPKSNVRGPFDEQKFAVEKQRLGLPEFSRIFDELK